MDIQDFCKEVRGCDFCLRSVPVQEKRTPFVYGGGVGGKTYDPKVLVVSEIPSHSAWIENIGARWEQGHLFDLTKKAKAGAPHTREL